MTKFITPEFERDGAGIYLMKFNTGCFYIGGTNNLRLRFVQWKTRLIAGTRKNIDLLIEFQKATVVEFLILEEVKEKSQLRHRENFYIISFWGTRGLMNKAPSAFNNKGMKQSLHRITPTPKFMQPVAKVGKNETIIEIYQSISECALKNNLRSRSLAPIFKKFGLKCKGDTYRKIDPDGNIIIPPVVPKKPRPHGYKVSEQGRENLRKAAERRKALGLPALNAKGVLQYSKDGDFIATHNSIADACKHIGLRDTRRMSKQINGRKGKSIYGFVFKFA